MNLSEPWSLLMNWLYPCTWTFSTLQWQKRFKVHTFSILIYRLKSLEILMLSFLFMGQALPTRMMKNGWRSSNLIKVMKMKSSNEIYVTKVPIVRYFPISDGIFGWAKKLSYWKKGYWEYAQPKNCQKLENTSQSEL